MSSSRLILAVDPPSYGGASHAYQVIDPYAGATSDNPHTDSVMAEIQFQRGPIAENGVNGLTNELLLTIVKDRLQSFQKGECACRENALALTKIEEAIHWLEARTADRQLRGVEGTSQR